MSKNIYFDMDGTIADFYGVEGWLRDLENFSTRPYQIARPRLNMSLLARYLNKLITKGYNINIISWCSKCGNQDYNEQTAAAKKEWLKKHLKSVKFNNIHIVDYGTPKSQYKNDKECILFDDDRKVRQEWTKQSGVAYDENIIIDMLKYLLSTT